MDAAAVSQLLLAIDHDCVSCLHTAGQDHLRAFGQVNLYSRRLYVEVRLFLTLFRSGTTASMACPSALLSWGRSCSLQLSGRISRFDDVNVAALGTGEQRCGWNDDRIRPLLQDQSDIHKLIGKESTVFIVKYSLHLDGAGGGIDLVVNGEYGSSCEMVCAGTVIRLYG
jgi:hypothetical protein